MKKPPSPIPPEEPTPRAVIPISALPKDPDTVRIAELEETLSQTRTELAYALNQTHQMRRWLLQIRQISNNINLCDIV